MTGQLVQMNEQLREKEQLIEQIAREKREALKQLENVDGVKLIDLNVDSFEDLRMSYDSVQEGLDDVVKERDSLRKKLEVIQREHLNQTLELNLDMRDEVEKSREEALHKSEQLLCLQKRYTLC